MFAARTILTGTIFETWCMYTATTWFGMIIIGVSVFTLGHIIRGILFLISRRIFDASRHIITYCCIAGMLLVSCYALYEARAMIEVTHITIPTEKLTHPVRIVQISDAHLDLERGNKLLRTLIRKTQALHPDMIAITGDFFEINPDVSHKLSKNLTQLTKIAPCFAVTGNHEWYAGIHRVDKACQMAGIRLLRNEHVPCKDVEVVGIDDSHSKKFGNSIPSVQSCVAYCNTQKPVVLLFHRPLQFPTAAECGVTLQLSGHTHNGQLFPGNLLVALTYRYATGLHKRKESFLYVSRGAGTWGPTMRWFSRPEIVCITLEPKVISQRTKP